MEQLVNNLLDLFIYSYTGSVLLLTFIILRDIIKKPNALAKSLTTAIVGVILGLIWYYVIKEEQVDKLLYSFLFANAFYSLILKHFLKSIKVEYNNDKGVI